MFPFPPFRPRLRRSSLAPGRYLTNGSGLFRVVSYFDDDRSVLVVIEDCLTLETYACAALELQQMGYRGVRGSSRPAAAGRRPSTTPKPVLG